MRPLGLGRDATSDRKSRFERQYRGDECISTGRFGKEVVVDAVRLFVGVDWGAATHQVCVVDRDRKVVEERAVAHDGEAIGAMVERLLALVGGNVEHLVVGIESPWNAVVETLLDRGVHVFCINPKQLDRFRDRHTIAGAKDDRRDAFVIADSLRTDAAAFREIKLGDARLVELRELSRIHDELGEEHRALANRLYQQMLRIFPQIFELGSVHRDGWILALIERAPTPEQARSLSLAKIRTILRTHHVRKWTAEQVRDVLRKKPLTVAPGVTVAVQTHIRLLLPRLMLLDSQMRETRRAMQRLLDELEQPADDPNRKEHRDVTILRSLPGVGMIVAATMLSEARDALESRDYHHLRALCGTAPVTRQSGKSCSVSMRRACSHRLRTAVFFMAKTMVAHDPRAKALYAAHRARGHSPGHALRVVADRGLALLVAMLRSATAYDPSKRRLAPAA